MERRHRIIQMRDQIAAVFQRCLGFLERSVRVTHAWHDVEPLELLEYRWITELGGKCDDRCVVQFAIALFQLTNTVDLVLVSNQLYRMRPFSLRTYEWALQMNA